jgi:hypothetical protein
MLITLTQSFLYIPTMMIRGSVVDVPNATATEWLAAGLAVTVTPVVETATNPPYEKAVRKNKRS